MGSSLPLFVRSFIYLYLFSYICVFIYLCSLFIYNMLSSLLLVTSLGLLAKADPLSASRRVESLPPSCTGLKISLYRLWILAFIFTHTYLFIISCVLFITCPIPSCWSLRALSLLQKLTHSLIRAVSSRFLFVLVLDFNVYIYVC